MSLFNDVRPLVFDDIIGNKAVVKALKHFTQEHESKRPHTFMFEGPSGCGKTTLARILAIGFGCDGIDLQELNAANTRGIDTIRDIVENAYLQPISGGSRVYILDESHQFTTAAQQALLKVIEDVPSHSYFIFCTTNPEKIIPTIKNRCSVFKVESLNEKNMGKLLDATLKKLGKDIPDKVYWRIIDFVGGCPRKALTSLESALTVDDEKEQMSLVEVTVEDIDARALCRALLDHERWQTVAAIYKKVKLKQPEPETIRLGVLGYMRSVLLSGNKNETASKIISIFEENTYSGGTAMLVRMLYDCSRL